MSKIAKFLASALNNSSPNEAAQALKMAAAAMQAEGVNPKTLLQAKGATDSSALAKLLNGQINDLKAELAECKQDYNGMVEKYNQVVRAYKGRGDKLAELQAQLSGRDTVTQPKATGAYADILNELNQSEAARAERGASHPKGQMVKQMFANLKELDAKFRASVHYAEPCDVFPFGAVYVFSKMSGDSYDYHIVPDSTGFKVGCSITGPRGGTKGNLSWSFDSESELMRWLFKRAGVLK